MNKTITPALADITNRIVERSRESRAAYLARINTMKTTSRARARLSASNLAHGYAALPNGEKIVIKTQPVPMIGIVSSYNDVLSAHEPLGNYPELLKAAIRKAGGIGQFAGGVPAMCDGVTQGQPGMDLSLFSRDVIAQATAIALTHDLYDGALLLGVCDKIVPGLLIGALSFGHMPMIFVPAGPMGSGLSNDEKARIRKAAAQGEVGPEALLDAEMAAYHSRGTCTFYGTANSNQFLLEAMGLMLPGAAFEHPDSPMRKALTENAATQLTQLATLNTKPGISNNLAEMVDEKAIINAIIALLATGGSTNHTMHWVAIAKAAGVIINWSDFDAISRATPLLARVYPNGSADVNDMHNAGGVAYILRELLDAGMMHGDVKTVVGNTLYDYAKFEGPSKDESVLRPANKPFAVDGGIRLLAGNIGRAVVKVAAVSEKHRRIKAPAKVFDTQDAVLVAFKADQLNHDCVVVVRGQGPRACGMPELHKLTPALSVLQDKGFSVALVTDGRMSGASGKIPAAIHVAPEAACGGLLAKVIDGDVIEVDCEDGILALHVSEAELAKRTPAKISELTEGWGRELFANFRATVTGAEDGAGVAV